MLADSSFLKNIFYFSKYEKDMINDETIEVRIRVSYLFVLRVRGGLTSLI